MFSKILLLILAVNYFNDVGEAQEVPKYFLTAAKSVPRIGRSNKGNSDFEKFFLKASKSVPRIGRRNENPYLQSETDKDAVTNQLKYPTWSEMADTYELQPELFHDPELLYRLEQQMGDDPNVQEWDKFRMKRKVPARFILNEP